MAKTKKLNKEKKKDNKIIFLIIGVVLIIISIVAFFIYREINFRKPIKESWGNKYYMYLKDEEVIPEDVIDAKVTFIETQKQDKPVMIVNYKKDKKIYNNVYYIEGNNINTIIYDEPTEIVLLYDINNQIYNYYYHIVRDNKDYYDTIDKQIENVKSEEKLQEQEFEYIFDNSNVIKTQNKDGNEVELNEFDRKFIEVEYEENYVELNESISMYKLKKLVENSIKEFETIKEIVTDDVKIEIDKRIEELNYINENLKTTMIDNLFEKAKGYYCDKESLYCVRIFKKKDKYMFDNFYYASEVGYVGEIKDIVPKSDTLFELQFEENSFNFDISMIDKKYIICDKQKLKYTGNTLDQLGHVLLGY